MGITEATDMSIDSRIGARIKALRIARDWSLDDLAGRSGVSRATLSRLENAEVSGTASVLGKLCTAFGLTLSRLMHLAERGFQAHIARSEQPVWHDKASGFTRRQVSPPAQMLAGEAIACDLEAGARIAYDAPPRPGLEHHLVLLEGQLTVTIAGMVHALQAGDCLRYQLHGSSTFATPQTSGARYLLFMV